MKRLSEIQKTINLNDQDTKILSSISKASISAIETTIGSLTHLIQNLNIYKETMIQSINLQAEQADMTAKYVRDIPQQSNTLPGVISTPQSYDLESIRKDNERMTFLSKETEKISKQKNIYLRLASEDVRLFLSSWKRLNLANASFEEFIESLNNQIDRNY